MKTLVKARTVERKNMKELVIYGAMTIILTLVIFVFLHTATKKKKDKKYLDSLKENYNTLGVYQSLDIAKKLFPVSSMEYIAIDKGLHYLKYSILMDYRTCFQIIENVFNSKSIKHIHKDILDKEHSKCLLLLEKKE